MSGGMRQRAASQPPGRSGSKEYKQGDEFIDEHKSL
jgi:hypothetical protein